ncbi:ribosome silencing factor [Sphaerotilus montanus]|jgi:ribosome-associated protein|uniref:Ribosomal silencing factor RsfS n=1 Tax=Sphaerotilus montanus TaxID=522889 RepID=A0A7Y9R0J2_9BURK|nr:ribosome silencing factor [Sphaerotilus montanus]NYG34668.1 ribosome-associated protein [Sphaerotilus montanus]NZD57148.1 ribosome silencing factor [Sphaerotilus montanus]
MDIRKLQRTIVDGLEDVKAQDIVVFNTEHLSAMFERVVIASGTSNRQTKSLAASVRDKVKSLGGDILSVEGEDNGEWIIVDCGAAVVHVMQPAIRQYYHLEEIWGGKPVRLKLASATQGLVKASRDEDEDEDDAPAAPARKAAPRKRSSSAAEAAADVKKPAAKKAPARKTAATSATGTVARKAPARKTAAGAAQKIKTVVINAPDRERKAPARKKAAAPKRSA